VWSMAESLVKEYPTYKHWLRPIVTSAKNNFQPDTQNVYIYFSLTQIRYERTLGI